MGSFTIRSQGAVSSYFSSLGENAAEISTGPSKLWSATMYNGGITDKWFQVFNATTTPANGTTPDLVMKILAGNTGSFDFTDGVPMSTGIVVACSTTDFSLTVDTTDESLFCVAYRRKI